MAPLKRMNSLQSRDFPAARKAAAIAVNVTGRIGSFLIHPQRAPMVPYHLMELTFRADNEDASAFEPRKWRGPSDP
jgi:hypothetical protein